MSFTIGAADEGATVAAALRRQLRQEPDGPSWEQVRRLCTTGKVFVDDERTLDPARRVRTGQRVSLDRAAPRPSPARGRPEPCTAAVTIRRAARGTATGSRWIWTSILIAPHRATSKSASRQDRRATWSVIGLP